MITTIMIIIVMTNMNMCGSRILGERIGNKIK